MRYVATRVNPEEMKEVWAQILEVKRVCWRRHHASNQRKVEHLVRKSVDCSKRNKCKELSNLVGEWVKSWFSNADGSGGTLPTPRPYPLGTPPGLTLVSRTKTEDRIQLEAEEEMILYEVRKYNQELVCKDLKESKDKVVTYGDVILSEEERELLNLGPGFMVTKPLSMEEMAVEANITVTKIRWGRKTRGVEEMTEEEIVKMEKEAVEAGENMEEQERLDEALDLESKDVIGEDGRSFDMGRQRATGMKNNRRVFMPGPAPPRVEAGLNTRMDIWRRTYAQHMLKNCNSKGEQKESNLSIEQQLAMKSLGKRISKDEIVVRECDKGKRFVVMPMSMYTAMGNDHTDKDVSVTVGEVRKSQKILSTAAKSMVNMFGVGRIQSHHNYTSCHDNAGSTAEDVHVMTILPKIHKKVTDEGHPQSRPVVTAATAYHQGQGTSWQIF